MSLQLNNEQLDKLHKCHLDLLCEVKRICENNNINYFITDGTLLGAIKYKGPIPWDDDADIGMLKKDYDYFMKICETELGNAFCLNNYYTEPQYGNSFAELCIRDTMCRKSTDPEYGEQRNGIFIDIHPFINVPKSRNVQWLFSRVCKFYKVLLMLKCGYNFRNASKKSQTITRLISRLYSKNKLIRKIEKLSNKYKDTKMAAQVFGHRYTRNNVCVANINRLESVQYSGFCFPAQPDYDRILKAVYGKNYMEPIEIEKFKCDSISIGEFDEKNGEFSPRDIYGGRHGITQLDFGNYKIHNSGKESV